MKFMNALRSCLAAWKHPNATQLASRKTRERSRGSNPQQSRGDDRVQMMLRWWFASTTSSFEARKCGSWRRQVLQRRSRKHRDARFRCDPLPHNRRRQRHRVKSQGRQMAAHGQRIDVFTPLFPRRGMLAAARRHRRRRCTAGRRRRGLGAAASRTKGKRQVRFAAGSRADDQYAQGANRQQRQQEPSRSLDAATPSVVLRRGLHAEE